jgi:acyl carrier protein
MSEPDIYNELTQIFDELFDLDDVALGPATTADDVDGWDSLNHIRLILAVQKKFGVQFSSGEIGDLKNVGDLVQLIAAKA